MQFSNFKNKTARRNILAKVDILGSFDFYTSLVSLDSLSVKDIDQAKNVFQGLSLSELVKQKKLTLDQYSSAAKVFPLAAHEYAHFIDSTSTLWGMQHLSLMNEAYLSNDKYGTPETHFANAKRFFDHSRLIRLPSYYTVVNHGVDNIRPWQSNISVGHIFSSDGRPTDSPILFSRFSNFKGELLARSPVSMVSLLEASAMAQELILQATFINMTESDFRFVEQSEFSKRTLDYIYNPEITEYSVCAHIAANAQSCTDILGAFRLCAIISRALLNFPETAIAQLADNCPVGELLKLPEDHHFVIAIRNGLRCGNLGVMYYLLCIALPKNAYVNEKASIDGVVQAFAVLGVDFYALREESKGRANDICQNLMASTIQPIALLAQAGLNNFLKISEAKSMLDFVNLSLPPALLGDSSVFQLFDSPDNLLAKFDFDACFDELSAGQLWVERFSEACV